MFQEHGTIGHLHFPLSASIVVYCCVNYIIADKKKMGDKPLFFIFLVCYLYLVILSHDKNLNVPR